MDEQRPWHRLFGLSWQDFFHGAAVRVELEKDLSHRQQLLDLVILCTEGVLLGRRRPDGFEDLGQHSLVSFKSYQEALDGWTLNELVGHYVNYRKQVSPTMQDLLPETAFRLFAVCARFPRDLVRQVRLEMIQEGVYEARHFTGVIRVVVIPHLPRQEHNAMLHLFSANPELVEYGARPYQPHSGETSTLLHQLFFKYQKEGLMIPLTLEELHRQTVEEILKQTPPEKRVEGLSAEDLLKALTPEVRAALARRLKGEEPPAKGE